MASSLTAAVATFSRTRAFKKSDAETKNFILKFLTVRGQDGLDALTNNQLLDLYLQETIQHQKELVGHYQGQQELIVLEQQHQQEIAAAKVGIEAEVDV